MGNPLHLLLLEDRKDDADLVLRRLREVGFDPQGDCVATEKEFVARLDPSLDIILSDYHLPGFNALRALELVRGSGIDVPVLIISGTAGEEMAVEALQAGAADYLLKDRLWRLESSIKRAMDQRHLLAQMRRAEKALRDSEERFRTVFDNSPALVFLKDIEGCYVDINPQFERLFGLKRDEILGKTDAEIFAAEQAAAFRANDGKVLQAGTAMEFEEVARYQDGLHTSIVIKFPLRDAQGNVNALCGIATDITDRKRVEEEREHLLRQMQKARERLQLLSLRLVEVQELERRRIARELHDEIGQELTALKLTLQMAARLPAESITTAFHEAQGQVGELLSRVRELSLDLRPAMLDDLGLLPALLWHFERYSTQTGVRVKFRHSGLEGKRTLAELETAAYRIIQEALTNVARHAKVKEAAIWVRLDAQTLWVHVEDKGSGFDSEAALAARRSSGLSGMRERAALLGGTVLIESSPGTGTRLTAELPLVGADFTKSFA